MKPYHIDIIVRGAEEGCEGHCGGAAGGGWGRVRGVRGARRGPCLFKTRINNHIFPLFWGVAERGEGGTWGRVGGRRGIGCFWILKHLYGIGRYREILIYIYFRIYFLCSNIDSSVEKGVNSNFAWKRCQLKFWMKKVLVKFLANLKAACLYLLSLPMLL